MNNKYIFVAFISALIFNQSILANEACTKIGQVSGNIRATNLSDKIQNGVIKLVIKVNGKTYFKKKGRIIGRTVAQGVDANTGQPFAIINHDIFFGWQTILATSNDQSLLTPTRFENGMPCAFNVTETITTAMGTNKLRILSNNTHNVVAEGSISFCSDNNKNILKLSGSICLD